MNNYDDLLNNAPAEPQSGQLSKEEYADKKRAEREEVFDLSDGTALEVSACTFTSNMTVATHGQTGQGGAIQLATPLPSTIERSVFVSSACAPETCRSRSASTWTTPLWGWPW